MSDTTDEGKDFIETLKESIGAHIRELNIKEARRTRGFFAFAERKHREAKEREQ